MDSFKAMNVDLSVKATNGPKPGFGDVRFNLVAEAKSGGHGDLGVETKVRTHSSKLDQLSVDVRVGDWAKEPRDLDDLDVLICLGGVRPGPKSLPLTKQEKRDVDLNVHLEFEGLPLKATLRPLAKEMKPVKCLDADGRPSFGLHGTVDGDVTTLRFLLSTESGTPLAVLALNLVAEGADWA